METRLLQEEALVETIARDWASDEHAPAANHVDP